MAVRAAIEPTTAPGRLEPRPDRGLPFAEALDETTRDHRSAFKAINDEADYRRLMAVGLRGMRSHRGTLALLAESERRDREAEIGHANIRSGLAG